MAERRVTGAPGLRCRCFGCRRSALQKQAVDLTIIASPVPFHLEQASLALRAGSHVLCEKPLVPLWVAAVWPAEVEAEICRSKPISGFGTCFLRGRAAFRVRRQPFVGAE